MSLTSAGRQRIGLTSGSRRGTLLDEAGKRSLLASQAYHPGIVVNRLLLGGNIAYA